MLKWLRFARQAHREEIIQPAHEDTFKWIFNPNAVVGTDSSAITEWLRLGNGIFWIKGKPGSGKSTLMKMLSNDDRTHQSIREWNEGSEPIFSSYYFWSQGGELENSDSGLLRSILCDVLAKCPALGSMAFPDWEPNHAAHEPKLIDALGGLRRIIASASFDSKLFILIDGLDEYAEDSKERKKLVDVLSQLAQSPRVKLLVSSRPLQELEEGLRSWPQLTIHHFTKACIRTLVWSTIRSGTESLEHNNSEGMDGLTEQIVDKSAGVFLWALLASETLSDGLSMQDSMEELQARLDELPPDLKDLFTFILKRISPRYRREAHRLLRIAYRWQMDVDEPLPGIVLSFASDYEAVRDSLSTGSFTGQCSPSVRLNRLGARLRACCLGLLETTDADSARLIRGETGRPYVTGKETIQFMHKTVTDYLSNAEAWEAIAPFGESEFDADLAIATGLIAAMTIHNEQRTWSDWMPAVNLIVQFCRRTERHKNTDCSDLLEAFDAIMSKALTDSDTEMVVPPDAKHDAHWSNFLKDLEDFFRPASHEDNFLSFTIRCGLELYAKARLDERGTDVSVKRGRPLLDYAVYPLPSWSPIGGGMNPRLASYLLECGSDPNEPFDGSTPWVNALYILKKRAAINVTGDEDKVISKHYTDALDTLRALLAAGADPHASCSVYHRVSKRQGHTVHYKLPEVLDHILQMQCLGFYTIHTNLTQEVDIASCDCSEAVKVRSHADAVRKEYDQKVRKRLEKSAFAGAGKESDKATRQANVPVTTDCAGSAPRSRFTPTIDMLEMNVRAWLP